MRVGFQVNVMPVTVPLVAPSTVRVSPSPGNDPAVICDGGEVELGVVRVGDAERRRKRYRGGILLVRGIRHDVMRGVIDGHDRDKRESRAGCRVFRH